MDISNRRVAYFYNEDIGKFYYYKDHPMKPRRITMAHSLIETFDLYRKMDVYDCRKATKQQIIKFHHPDYINYLENYVCSDILSSEGFTRDILIDGFSQKELQRKAAINNSKLKSQFLMSETGDCPGFVGLFEFCQMSCGGSIDSAHVLMQGAAEVAINWGGGLHHAKKCETSGFCYTNDIVLGILELLKIHPRVLYIDVDVHHGDGVEQAFFLTDRVMTVSFHQYGEEFFPGTGALESIGEGKGKYYSLNIPLKPGIDDDMYDDLFHFVIDQVVSRYRPGAIVLQLGADSIAYDILGKLNLSIKGHGQCVKRVLRYGLPTMLLGGGGYTVHNVARCWAYETGVALGEEIQGTIPKSDRFYQAYLPDTKLHFLVKPVKNRNTPQEIHQLKEKIKEHLRLLQPNPGVPFHNIPTMAFNDQESIEKQPKSLIKKRNDQ